MTTTKEIKRIGVFTSGGDAPGMNAAIRAVVRTATTCGLHVYGIQRGYQGMIEGDFIRLETNSVRNIIHRGGTILKTARSKDFTTKEGRQRAFESLTAFDIDGVVAIGGDGTFTGGKIFYEEFGIPFIGIPGTIDNDLNGTDFTLGFDTAVNTAIEAVDRIRDTADSHNRLFFIEVMGRHSGYIALYTGIASGASGILVPEKKQDYSDLVSKLKKGIKRNKLFSLVIVAEGDETGGAYKVADFVKQEFPQYDVKVAIIGHIQRGGAPSLADRILASRLGSAAVYALLAGHQSEMVGIINNQIAYTSFGEAIVKTKPFQADLLKIADELAL